LLHCQAAAAVATNCAGWHGAVCMLLLLLLLLLQSKAVDEATHVHTDDGDVLV
jgi:hypothetical protein